MAIEITESKFTVKKTLAEYLPSEIEFAQQCESQRYLDSKKFAQEAASSILGVNYSGKK